MRLRSNCYLTVSRHSIQRSMANNSQRTGRSQWLQLKFGGKRINELIRISSAKTEPQAPALQKARGTPRVLHPLPPGPKGKEGSCWAAYTQAPSKSYQQGRATSGHHSGRQPCTRRNTPLLSKAPVLRLMYLHLAHKMALTEKLCSLFSLLSLPLSPGSPLALDWFREGLPPTETPHHFPT